MSWKSVQVIMQEKANLIFAATSVRESQGGSRTVDQVSELCPYQSVSWDLDRLWILFCHGCLVGLFVFVEALRTHENPVHSIKKLYIDQGKTFPL
jgi:hypothetical protein